MGSKKGEGECIRFIKVNLELMHERRDGNTSSLCSEYSLLHGEERGG